MARMLEFQDVSMSFYTNDGELEVLKNISLEIEEGTINAIIGPSGCGKSTILNLISGLLKPTSGIITNHYRYGYMFQRDNLFEWLTILDNVTLGLKIQKKLNKETREYAIELLNKYGLGDFIKRYPAELSGGMRQRVALIRMLVIQPEILLLDEPFSALDAQTRLAVSQDIYDIIRKENKTTIIVTHDISEAIAMADRVFVLTKRPSKVRETIDIELSCENKTPLLARNAPEFRVYFDKIWRDLMCET